MKQASANLAELKKLVGKKVRKVSIKKKDGFHLGKPFKSKSYINTVKDVILHPIRKTPAFTFVEDDSHVAVETCVVLRENPERRRKYGLDLLDRIQYGDGGLKGTVIEIDGFDNNSVYVLWDSYPYEGSSRVTDAVAERCEVIDVKVELNERYYHMAYGPITVLEFLPENTLKISVEYNQRIEYISNKNLRPLR